MKDALPTIKDVREIVFRQQRRKNLIPEHAALTNELNLEINRLKDALESDRDNPRLKSDLQRELTRKREREAILFEELRSRIQDYILDQPTKVRLSTRVQNGRQITTFSGRRTTLLLFDRYVSRVLAKAFGVRTTGRDQLVRTAINALNITRGAKASARTILKVDIKQFFGSVEHGLLQEKIGSHSGIPRFVERHIVSILEAHERVHGGGVGIPQGVPSSSILSEIYLEDFDQRIKQHPRVVLYLRYVDDLFVIIHGSHGHDVRELIHAELRSLGLRENPNKFSVISHPSRIDTSVDFLGYSFLFASGHSNLSGVDITQKKYERYIIALDRLNAFGDRITCWTDVAQVDRFIGAYEYLLFSHKNRADGDSMRIITGLAYSARFVRPADAKPVRLADLACTGRARLYRRFGPLRSKATGELLCPCCADPIHRSEEIWELGKRAGDLNEVLYAPAALHLRDDLRDDIRRILWS